MTVLPAITNWAPEARPRLMAAIIDAALPRCTYRFVMQDGAVTVTSSPEPPAVGEYIIYDPLSTSDPIWDDVVLDFLVERLFPALTLLKIIYGIDDGPADEKRTTVARKARRPTLPSVVKQASKAGIPVARFEVKPDSIVVVPGKPEPAAPENPWPLDEFRRKETRR
jgi:hypothetical protein